MTNEARARQLAEQLTRAARAVEQLPRLGARFREQTLRARSGRSLDAAELCAMMELMREGFDSLDALLGALPAVRQQLVEVSTAFQELLTGSSLETDAKVKEAITGATAHALTTQTTAPRQRAQRIVVRSSVLRRRQ